jgi:hypothetical protein
MAQQKMFQPILFGNKGKERMSKKASFTNEQINATIAQWKKQGGHCAKLGICTVSDSLKCSQYLHGKGCREKPAPTKPR